MPSARRHLCRIAVGLALLVVPAAAVAQVFVDAAGTCAGMTPCFMTIQAGVNNASANNSLVVVFPGTYAESVNLSLMGSAVAQPGGDIVIINYVIYAEIIAAPATAPAAAAAATGSLAAIADQLSAARRRVLDAFAANVGGLYRPPAGDPNAAMALPQVNVFPISGPAIFHTGSFPPNSMAEGSVSLYGLTVKSPDASGIDLPNVTGSIGLLAVHTDENAGEGAFLRAGDEINLSAVTAHRNDSIGVDAISTNAEALLIDVSANGNKADGVTVVAKGSVLVFTADFSDLSGLPLQDFSGSTFNGNKGDGLRASSSDGSVVVARSFLLLNGTGSFVEANDNTGRGMDFGSADGVTLVGVRADRNASGITAVSDDDILVIGVSANNNTTAGGVKATSSSDGSNFIFGIGVLVLSSTASGNAGAGFELTDTMGNVAVLGSAAVMNGIDGVRLTALAGDTSSVEGNILCDNTASGLRLLSATSVNGEGNWWGSATGPTHPGNPGGTGNAVIDGSNGGAGTVDYLPFIDTVTSLAPAATAIHQTTSVHFQFSGGGGTVFLGVPESFAFIFPAGVILPPDPPFTLTTDNGVLIDEDESAATIHSAINEPEGVLAVRLKAAQLGTATVTLDGPCGLDSLVTLQIGRLSTAPVLSLIALASLAALLALAGARRVSSR